LTAGGGRVETGRRVTAIQVLGGRAVAVRTQDGAVVRARRAILADVTAPSLYRDLVGPAHLPSGLLRRLDDFQWDHPTFKVNWALDRPVPWTAHGARRAGTVHLGVDPDGFVDVAADLSTGRVPQRPFLLLGQMTTADPTRSPAGTESAWAYTHVPHGLTWSPDRVRAEVELVESTVERLAPGFGATVLGQHVQSPDDLENSNASLVGGAVNGGTSAIHQQLVFRPTTGLGRPETPIQGLFLASASAHPGGGVHGACGWNAARAALGASGPTGHVRRLLVRTAWERVLGDRDR
jgi:phytoene dehydrogenase-like protein